MYGELASVRRIQIPFRLLSAAVTMLTVVPPAEAGGTHESVPMEAAGWHAASPVSWAGTAPASLRFARYEGMPTGTMTVEPGIAVSNDARFTEGTIDFDMKPLGYDDAGIIFRRHSDGDGEFLYLRANPDCPAADDCIQYAPISHGLMQWDIYADHQGPAPITSTGWNHVHLVVGGAKMLVYINYLAKPTLVVPRLQGLPGGEGIAFKGAATYANLVIRSGPAHELDAIREPPATTSTLTAWMAAPPVPASNIDKPATFSAIPTSSAWAAIAAEPSGLVNLTRAFGRGGPAPALELGWLRTEISAAAPCRRLLQLGWARQITVFLNGRQVFEGSNPYEPVERRLSPDGRLEPDNASIQLDLRAGRNELVLAVGNGWNEVGGHQVGSFYGWAAEARILDLTGLTLSDDGGHLP